MLIRICYKNSPHYIMEAFMCRCKDKNLRSVFQRISGSNLWTCLIDNSDYDDSSITKFVEEIKLIGVNHA